MSYNGYSNYETWRIMLELICGNEEHFSDTFVDACVRLEITEPNYTQLSTNAMCDMKNEIEGFVDNCITEGGENDNIAVSYARAFLQKVDYWELADKVCDILADTAWVWEEVKEHFEANGMDY